MKGIIKFDFGYTSVDGEIMLELEMWCLERGATEWKPLGFSYFKGKEDAYQRLKSIESRGWEILMDYKGNFM